MYYQIRSNDVVIGHADLGFGEMMPRSRVGSFRPNSVGLPLMERFAAITRAHRAFRSRERPPHERDEPPSLTPECRTLYADIMAAHREAESLELRLHGLDGTPIPTEYITIRDLREVLILNSVFLDDDGERKPWEKSWEAEPEDEADAGAESEDGEDSPDRWRYHIAVDLVRGDAIP